MLNKRTKFHLNLSHSGVINAEVSFCYVILFFFLCFQSKQAQLYILSCVLYIEDKINCLHWIFFPFGLTLFLSTCDHCWLLTWRSGKWSAEEVYDNLKPLEGNQERELSSFTFSFYCLKALLSITSLMWAHQPNSSLSKTPTRTKQPVCRKPRWQHFMKNKHVPCLYRHLHLVLTWTNLWNAKN